MRADKRRWKMIDGFHWFWIVAIQFRFEIRAFINPRFGIFAGNLKLLRKKYFISVIKFYRLDLELIIVDKYSFFFEHVVIQI